MQKLAASLLAAASMVSLSTTAVASEASWPAPSVATLSAPSLPAQPPSTSSPPTSDCSVDLHAGVSEEDVPAVEQIVCAEVRQKLPAGPAYRVRIARLGGKVVLSLVTPEQPDKQLVLSNIDEVPIAAPRLVESLTEGKPTTETMTVTNVVGGEARAQKKKSGEIHAWLGMVGVTALGSSVATGAGANAGLSAGSERWSFVGDLRLAGGDVKFAALSGGVRHTFSASDTAPFATIGIALAAMEVDRKHASDLEGGGLALFGEIGLEVLRARQFGGAIVLRTDVPTFNTSYKSQGATPLLTLGLAMRF